MRHAVEAAAEFVRAGAAAAVGTTVDPVAEFVRAGAAAVGTTVGPVTGQVAG